MKRVRLRLAPGGVHPVYELLTASPHVERAAGIYRNVADDGTLTMLHRVVGTVAAVERRLGEIDSLREYHVVRVAETDGASGADERPEDDVEEAYVYLRDDGTDDSRLLFRALSTDGLLTVGPIEYDDTGARFTVVGEERAITSAHESIPDRFDVAIEGVGGIESAIDPTSALSERQREAASVGVELGYFDVPRTASHEDVAGELECSPSTAAEHLQKAQSKIVRAAMGGDDAQH